MTMIVEIVFYNGEEDPTPSSAGFSGDLGSGRGRGGKGGCGFNQIMIPRRTRLVQYT